MKKLDCVRLVVPLVALLVAGPLLAQTSDGDSANTNPHAYDAQVAGGAADSTQSGGSSSEQQTQYAPALNGSGLISMDGKWKTHMLLGATMGGGWDSSPGGLLNGTASGLYTLSPYFGIKANTTRTQYLLQYQPTITRYTSSTYTSQTMHAASARVIGTMSERWSWDLRASGDHGQDSIRLLAPQQIVAVGQVPGTGSNAASYLPNAGQATHLDSSFTVRYRKSERDSIEVGVGNSYSRFTGLNESGGAATVGISYGRALSPTLGVTLYGQNSYYYGALRCTSFGFGGGFKWQVQNQTYLALSAGPQLNTPACGNQQGFAYDAAFSTRLTAKSQIYVLSARQSMTSFLGPGLWQVTSSGGYQRQVMAKGSLNFDVGYVKSDTLATSGSYHGAFFDGVYGHQLGHGLNASVSYRGYVGEWQGANSNRNVAMFSLAWSPISWMPIAGRVFQ